MESCPIAVLICLPGGVVQPVERFPVAGQYTELPGCQGRRALLQAEAPEFVQEFMSGSAMMTTPQGLMQLVQGRIDHRFLKRC